MFQSARFKLTAWYLVILMAVSFLFSAVIYRVVTTEIERSFRQAEVRLKASEIGIPLPLPNNLRIFLIEDVEDAKRRVFRWLLGINMAIFGFSAIASFMLAGKTLAPIQEAMDEQKRFVSDASHELHTPLTALKTTIEVALRDKKLTAQGARRVMQESLKDVDDLTNLSQNLLALSRVEHNSQSLSFTRVDMDEIVRQTIKKLSSLAAKKKVQLESTLQPVVISGDEIGLGKMVTILLDNAIKYTPQNGKITISVKQVFGKCVVTVADTGIGIPHKDISRIFERFFRADLSRGKNTFAGYGLGLSIAKHIVEIHRGTITVESKLNQGSVFTIRLPLSS